MTIRHHYVAVERKSQGDEQMILPERPMQVVFGDLVSVPNLNYINELQKHSVRGLRNPGCQPSWARKTHPDLPVHRSSAASFRVFTSIARIQSSNIVVCCNAGDTGFGRPADSAPDMGDSRRWLKSVSQRQAKHALLPARGVVPPETVASAAPPRAERVTGA